MNWPLRLLYLIPALGSLVYPQDTEMNKEKILLTCKIHFNIRLELSDNNIRTCKFEIYNMT